MTILVIILTLLVVYLTTTVLIYKSQKASFRDAVNTARALFIPWDGGPVATLVEIFPEQVTLNPSDMIRLNATSLFDQAHGEVMDFAIFAVLAKYFRRWQISAATPPQLLQSLIENGAEIDDSSSSPAEIGLYYLQDGGVDNQLRIKAILELSELGLPNVLPVVLYPVYPFLIGNGDTVDLLNKLAKLADVISVERSGLAVVRKSTKSAG